jgi:hypothetical protein
MLGKRWTRRSWNRKRNREALGNEHSAEVGHAASRSRLSSGPLIHPESIFAIGKNGWAQCLSPKKSQLMRVGFTRV